VEVSICMAAHNKAWALPRVLESIRSQQDGDRFEIVIADHGSTDNTRDICSQFGVRYEFVERRTANPAPARNAAYRVASGRMWVIQSADVVHVGESVAALASGLTAGTFAIASVRNRLEDGSLREVYTGPEFQRPLFFLGAAWADDVLAIGGDSEEFTEPGFDDDWFAACLMYGRQLAPVYLHGAIGHHLHHGRPADLRSSLLRMRALYRAKVRRGEFRNPPLD
jgi:glycosyltransferase involved in cell wall biosynthesis